MHHESAIGGATLAGGLGRSACDTMADATKEPAEEEDEEDEEEFDGKASGAGTDGAGGMGNGVTAPVSASTCKPTVRCWLQLLIQSPSADMAGSEKEKKMK
jgi:hypothetical protein